MKMKIFRQRKISGFTLIEVLIAVAITMILGWLISLAFTNVSSVSKNVTSTLDYETKGRAIMDNIAYDIENMIKGSKTYLIDTPTQIVMRSHLPRLRTRFGNERFGTHDNYATDIVFVKWEYLNGELKKYVSRPLKLSDGSPFIDNDEGIPGTYYPLTHDTYNFTSTGEVVTAGDIRGFQIKAVGKVYEIDFWLTNAPDNISSRPIGETSDVWVKFSRRIAPYVGANTSP